MKKLSLVALSVVAAAACAKKTAAPEAAAETETAMVEKAENPFFRDSWDTPYGVPPFSEIKEEHYAPAMTKGMEESLAEIDAIANNPESPTFENTIVEMERSGKLLNRTARVFFVLTGTDLTDGLQELRAEFAPKLAQHQDAIVLNEKLFERVKKLYEARESLGLDPEQMKLLEDYYRDFVRAGATVQGEEKERLKVINTELATLYTEFSKRLLKENNYLLILDQEEDLAGLPDEVKAAGAGLAEQRGHEGKWAYTLVRSSYEPFLTYSTRRDLREKLWNAFHDRGSHDGERDTREIAIEIATLRAERARIMGFENHAAYQLDGNMAKTPEAVYELLNKVFKGSVAAMKADRAKLEKLLRADLGKKAKLEPWDWRFYAEKLRKQEYDLSEEELKPYFQVDAVREGAFATAEKLFGITFREVTSEVPRYNPEAKAFEVNNADGSHVGLLYVDYFPRESKRSGAWATAFRGQRNLDARIRPVILNVGNFPAPAGDKPALLGWSEVETLFHEFGHALHALLSDVTYPSLRSVKRDYVEFPSQLLENWASEPTVIKSYAKHYQTGEPIPDELIAKIRKSSTFNKGFSEGEYVAAALLDLAWHTKSLEETQEITDVNAFDRETMNELGMIPEVAPRYYSPYFQHIFAGDGYASQYYVYGWSRVLAADAYAAFEAAGNPFDPELSQRLRQYIFSSGSSRDEMELYTRFRGQEPSVEPYLNSLGFEGVGG